MVVLIIWGLLTPAGMVPDATADPSMGMPSREWNDRVDAPVWVTDQPELSSFSNEGFVMDPQRGPVAEGAALDEVELAVDERSLDVVMVDDVVELASLLMVLEDSALLDISMLDDSMADEVLLGY